MMNTVLFQNLCGSVARGLVCDTLLLFSAFSVAQTTVPATGWNALLPRHVKVINGHDASQVDYAGVCRNQTQLDAFSHDPKVVARLRAQQVDISYLPYDWRLNKLAMP